MAIVWYIEPKSGLTSDRIGELVGEVDTCYDVLCSDGVPRNLYRVTYGNLREALMRRGALRFIVWKQQGPSPPKRFNPDLVFKGRRDPKVVEVAERLQERLMRSAQKAGKTTQERRK